jgi:transcription elongation factor Elf1
MYLELYKDAIECERCTSGVAVVSNEPVRVGCNAYTARCLNCDHTFTIHPIQPLLDAVAA